MGDRRSPTTGQIVNDLRVVPNRDHEEESSPVDDANVNQSRLVALQGPQQCLHAPIHPELAGEQILCAGREVVQRCLGPDGRFGREPHGAVAADDDKRPGLQQLTIEPVVSSVDAGLGEDGLQADPTDGLTNPLGRGPSLARSRYRVVEDDDIHRGSSHPIRPPCTCDPLATHITAAQTLVRPRQGGLD